MEAQVLIFGNGGHARVVRDALIASGRAVIACLDRADEHRAHAYPGSVAVVAVGDPRLRAAIVERITATFDGLRFTIAVHPTAIVAQDVTIGPGSVVMAGAVLNPGVVVSAHAIVNTRAVLDHDTRVGAFASVGPGSLCAGGVTLEDHVQIGMGAILLPGTHVGRNTVVGAGSLVLKDLPPDVTAYGSPCRVVGEVGSPRPV
jgi:acetyltransferase EpsM